MQIHASCASFDGAGVLLVGPPGSGKSDLVLRLLDRGFRLVADDWVEVEDGMACAPSALAGLLEIRGFGIVRMDFVEAARLALVVRLACGERMPAPMIHEETGLPLIEVDPARTAAPQIIALALDCLRQPSRQLAGSFAE